MVSGQIEIPDANETGSASALAQRFLARREEIWRHRFKRQQYCVLAAWSITILFIVYAFFVAYPLVVSGKPIVSLYNDFNVRFLTNMFAISFVFSLVRHRILSRTREGYINSVDFLDLRMQPILASDDKNDAEKMVRILRVYIDETAQKLQIQKHNASKWLAYSLIIAFAFVSLLLYAFVNSSSIAKSGASSYQQSPTHYLLTAGSIYGAAVMFWIINRYLKFRSIDKKIDDIPMEYQRLVRGAGLEREAAIEDKLFRENVVRTLTETVVRDKRWTFPLGVLCIFLGVIVFVVTLFFVFSADNTQEMFASGIVGLASTAITEAIGLMFFRLQRDVNEQIESLPERFELASD
ncbi:MAG: hypothetical protein AAF563_18610 [Pseudomonadota bacterium]